MSCEKQRKICDVDKCGELAAIIHINHENLCAVHYWENRDSVQYTEKEREKRKEEKKGTKGETKIKY